MIYGQCRTNLDDYKREVWPEEFVRVPLVGEQVMAKSGNNLKVYNITHRMFDKFVGDDKIIVAGVIIELNK